ncbi:basal body-orientation factor 1 [Halichoeres trimaculatus]|uniref:basal body-orientation factor 1 n=1 Tax=Halichoeres trimaculatus TaxID=147232 RepID=UPI003D9F3A82
MPNKKVSKAEKSKAGKGKKHAKQDSKSDKGSDTEKTRATEAMWELRLKISDRDLKESSKACYNLARANELLTSRLERAERDAMDVTGFWKRDAAAKEEKINKLQRSLKSQELLAREEQNKLTEDYTCQINELKELFEKKSRDFDMLQEKFNSTKFRMEQELRDMKDSMDAREKEHMENLNRMEYKFVIEKAQLKSEAERKMEEVKEAQEAHNEAIMENVRLSEVLKCHLKESDVLQKLTNSQAEENASVTLDKDSFKFIIKKKTTQMEAQKKELCQLRAKVAFLENTLEEKIVTHEQEMEKEKERSLILTQASQVELEKLQKVLAMREKELGRIKQLASVIIEQRTELEKFFHDALDQVRQEIVSSRLQYKKEAHKAYCWRMQEATAGRLKFPPIRTFHNSPHSTNSVYSDMEAASQWTHQPGDKVEISDLTWEQKEQLLGLIFAKMNGRTERRVSRPLASSPSSKKSLVEGGAAEIREEQSLATFITEASEPALPPNPTSLPDIRTT